jgi:hypothetical protein
MIIPIFLHFILKVLNLLFLLLLWF